jgi:hypothetical protein
MTLAETGALCTGVTSGWFFARYKPTTRNALVVLFIIAELALLDRAVSARSHATLSISALLVTYLVGMATAATVRRNNNND